MKRFLLILAFLSLLLVVGWTAPREGEPRNVRLRAQTVGDSILFPLRWTAPQRGGRQTPITGYDYEFWTSPIASDPTRTLVASGATTAEERQVSALLPFSCATASTFYTARVRATGDFSGPAPWGISNTIEVVCDNSPPGAPIVDLDTIQAEDLSTPADSTVLRPVGLSRGASYDWDRDALDYTALYSQATMCALAYRDGVPSVPLRGTWTLEPVTRGTSGPGEPSRIVPPNVVVAPSAEHEDLACWEVRAVANGSQSLELCNQTDCYPVLSGFGLAIFPPWMRWPLLALGIGCWVWASLRSRRKSDA